MTNIDPITSQLLTMLQRGGAFGHYWTNTRKSVWWPAETPGPIPAGWKNVYFGVHPVTEIPPVNAKGESKPPVSVRSQIRFIAALNCLFAEFDAKDFDADMVTCLAHVQSLDVPPTVIIDSGGGYHCYWLLTIPWFLNDDDDREQARKLQAAWVTMMGGDPDSKDLARVLRLPGTSNYKYEIQASDDQAYVPPRPVTIISANFDLLYDLDDLAVLAEPFIESDRPITTPSTTSASVSAKRMDAYTLKALMDEVELVKSASEGDKHRQLLKSASTLGELVAGGILDRDLVFNLLADAIRGRAKDMREAEQTILDGLGYGSTRPRGVPEADRAEEPDYSFLLDLAKKKAASKATDGAPADPGDPLSLSSDFIIECLRMGEAGDAQMTATLYAGQMVFDHAAGAWYTFGPHAWVRCDGVPRRAIWGRVAAVYLKRAAELHATAGSDKEAVMKMVDALTERAKKLRSVSRINNVLILAQELVGIKGNEWDANPHLLGVQNGVLDLRTGELRDGQPEDYIRITAPTEWRGLDTPAPRWERFVSEVLSDEAERVAFLQRLLGYALNGSTKEHVLSIFVGERGRNGKRVLFEALQHVLGEYSKSVSTDVLIGQDHMRGAGSAQPHLMELQGKRLAYCSETSEHDALSTSQVKNITGGDPITARWLHANPVTFLPSHTLFLQTNRRPQAPADDDALWERVKVIEFKVRFVEYPTAADERPRDPLLESTLQAEASGILAWLVRGGLEWQRGGLQTPASVRLARDTYRKGESIEPFIETCCTEWDGGSAEGGALYKAYKLWCEQQGLQDKSAVWLGKQLVQHYEKARVTTGANAGRTVYYGLTLREQQDWTVEKVPEVSTTLQDCTNPSVGIETPNNDDLDKNPEGLGSISKSSMQKSTHEEKNMENPSNPSVPSGLEQKQVLQPGYHITSSGSRVYLHYPSGAARPYLTYAMACAAAEQDYAQFQVEEITL